MNEKHGLATPWPCCVGPANRPATIAAELKTQGHEVSHPTVLAAAFTSSIIPSEANVKSLEGNATPRSAMLSSATLRDQVKTFP